MYYMLMDNTGNMIASYRDEEEARAALDEIVAQDPAAASEIALLTHDDEGTMAADPACVASTITVGAVHVESPDTWYGDELESGFEPSQTENPISALAPPRTMTEALGTVVLELSVVYRPLAPAGPGTAIPGPSALPPAGPGGAFGPGLVSHQTA